MRYIQEVSELAQAAVKGNQTAALAALGKLLRRMRDFGDKDSARLHKLIKQTLKEEMLAGRMWKVPLPERDIFKLSRMGRHANQTGISHND